MSADGVTWTAVDFNAMFGFGYGSGIEAVAYGNNPNGRFFH